MGGYVDIERLGPFAARRNRPWPTPDEAVTRTRRDTLHLCDGNLATT